MQRDTDVTGVSGAGRIANGVEFGDGTVAMRWDTRVASTTLYASIAHVREIHGHDGATSVVWVDD